MILVTGFAPFGGDEMNPSFEAAKGLTEMPELRGEVEIMALPVLFDEAADLLSERIHALQPSAVISVGLAGGRKEITPELIAVNFRDARIPDNTGKQPHWESIIPGGPDGIFTRLPVQEMIRKMREAGIPASLSTSAGTYVCNELMYRLLHDYDGPAGFIHVPASTEQGGTMSIQEMTKALGVCVRTLVGMKCRG